MEEIKVPKTNKDGMVFSFRDSEKSSPKFGIMAEASPNISPMHPEPKEKSEGGSVNFESVHLQKGLFRIEDAYNNPEMQIPISDRYLEKIEEEKFEQSDSFKMPSKNKASSSNSTTRLKESPMKDQDIQKLEMDKLMGVIANDEKLSSMVKDLKDTPLHDELIRSEDHLKLSSKSITNRPPDSGRLISENEKLKIEKDLLEAQIQLKNLTTAFGNYKKRAKEESQQMKEAHLKESNSLIKKMNLQREKFHEILETKQKEADLRTNILIKESINKETTALNKIIVDKNETIAYLEQRINELTAATENLKRSSEQGKLSIIAEYEAKMKNEEEKHNHEKIEFTKIFQTQIEEEKRKMEERFRTEYEYKIYMLKQKLEKENQERKEINNENQYYAQNTMPLGKLEKEYAAIKNEISKIKNSKTSIQKS